jgi:hypothetical protein
MDKSCACVCTCTHSFLHTPFCQIGASSNWHTVQQEGGVKFCGRSSHCDLSLCCLTWWLCWYLLCCLIASSFLYLTSWGFPDWYLLECPISLVLEFLALQGLNPFPHMVLFRYAAPRREIVRLTECNGIPLLCFREFAVLRWLTWESSLSV